MTLILGYNPGPEEMDVSALIIVKEAKHAQN